MKAQDWQDQNNERAKVAEKLANLCQLLGLSYHYTEKEFVVQLPDVVPIDVVAGHQARKRLNTNALDGFADWIASQKPDDSDELPPVDQPLDEGETPPETPNE